jgi:hypothetical protein
MKIVYNKLIRNKMLDIYKHDVELKISASDSGKAKEVFDGMEPK